jgi:hypothetical protein
LPTKPIPSNLVTFGILLTQTPSRSIKWLLREIAQGPCAYMILCWLLDLGTWQTNS